VLKGKTYNDGAMERHFKIIKGEIMKQWIVETKNGNIYTETGSKSWDDIDQDDIKKVQFDNNGQIISLPENMEEYIQAKTASADLGSNNIQIESRYLAFKMGNNIVRIRVDEKTNNISIEVE